MAGLYSNITIMKSRRLILAVFCIAFHLQSQAQYYDGFRFNRYEYFKQFEGFTIENITVHNGFEQVKLRDADPKVVRALVKTYNFINRAVHRNSSVERLEEYKIVEEKIIVDAYQFEEWERIMRSNSFLTELVYSIDVTDSSERKANLDIFATDGISIVPNLQFNSPEKYDISLLENNLYGSTNALGIAVYHDKFSKIEYAPSVDFTLRNPNANYVDYKFKLSSSDKSTTGGGRTANSLTVGAERPFISTYFKWQGSFTINIQSNANYRNLVEFDSLFKYGTFSMDSWIGWHNPFMKRKVTKPNQWNFLFALRNINRRFFTRPDYINPQNEHLLLNLYTVFSQVNFFKRKFDRYDYLFDLGRVEDIELGFNIRGGYAWGLRQENNSNYLGLETQYIGAPGRDQYLDFSFKMGAYFEQKTWVDILNSCSILYSPRKTDLNKVAIRHFFTLIYSGLHDESLYPLLSVSGDNALLHYKSNGFTGNNRFVLRVESFFNIKKSFLQLKIAPLLSAQMLLLNQSKDLHSQFHSAISTGFRLRHNQYSYQILDARFSFYPAYTFPGNNPRSFEIFLTVKSNFYNNIKLVSKPDFIYLY